MTQTEYEFSRKLENLIFGLIKDEPNVNVDEEYYINDSDKRFKVKINIIEI